jgi:regulator of cell morphogenesis and NO signaling
MNTLAPVGELIDTILSTHHEFLRREMPRITRLLSAETGLDDLKGEWNAFVEEMTAHLWKEERILFPMVRAMDAGMDASSHCGGVHGPLRVMLMEHDGADARLRTMRRLTNGYRSEGAGTTELYQALEALEADVREHVHKENDELFPRVAAMG